MDLVRSMFEEYQTELGVDLCFQGWDAEMAGLPGKYAPPQGTLLLGFEGQTAVVCGALRNLGEGICEMKRLYVRPAHRRHRIGKEACEKLIAKARELGYERIRLDTLRRLTPAFTLYKQLGFEEISPYNYNPEDDIVYFERPL